MEKFTKSKLVAQIAITSFVAALAIVGFAYATTIGTNISTTGTLGVGTSTPSATLAINTSEATAPFVIGSSTSEYLRMDHTGALTLAKAATLSSTLSVAGNLTVDTNTLYLNAASNRVGIATSAPAYTLDVYGDFNVGTETKDNTLRVDATNGKVGIGTSTPTFSLSITNTATQQVGIAYDETHYLSLGVSGAGNLTITPSGGATNITGQLGVSSSTPSATLAVGEDTATTTIDLGKACFRMKTDDGTVLYYWPCLNCGTSQGSWATSTASCFQ